MVARFARRAVLALAVFALWLALPRTGWAAEVTLKVFAAASLTEPLQALGRDFTRRHPGVQVTFNFAGSQELARQLHHGAPADVFAAANRQHMANAVTSRRIRPGAARTFAHNRLVAIISRSSAGRIRALPDLAKPGLKLILGDESVPVGRYTRQFLDKASQGRAFGAAYKTRVLANAVSFEPNVRMVVTKVALGEADAGVAYVSDVKGPAAANVVTVPIPDPLNVVADYPMAPLSDSAHEHEARAFVDYVLSEPAQKKLKAFGFIPAAGDD